MTEQDISLRPDESRFSGGKFLLVCLFILIAILAVGFSFAWQAHQEETELPPGVEQPAQTLDVSGGPS